MPKNRRLMKAAAAAAIAALVLAACQPQQPAETEDSPVTGAAEAFLIEGRVDQVVVETPGDDPATGGGVRDEMPPPVTGVAPLGTPVPREGAQELLPDDEDQTRLVVEIDSVDDETAELCAIGRGDLVTLLITGDTAIDPSRNLLELIGIEDQMIRAEGNAEELGDEADEPEPGQTPGTTEETGDETDGQGAGGTLGDILPGVGGPNCHFEVVVLTLLDAEPGDATATPTVTPTPRTQVPGVAPPPDEQEDTATQTQPGDVTPTP